MRTLECHFAIPFTQITILEGRQATLCINIE
jgi:hypothetical protein